ncbi:radical SAM/SPASM domain-containing protein [Paramaledivibacter caminithermalis]|jgi:uncharacterized protein|uniref:Radical SAM core domain-containing protein n=1 Tax=Paramaledivibacter caminithermalis (strain DSM 15212 / CIP 107654 / DViRD3) TaxID=1121301 RepID=A0A1M6SAT7_PARC5|nr:radical SAM protein [Paramaledivibacter caminithermalis]SHK41893.1 uncharacterized protein SAMN02745912_03247 [Paramaledivibacter caminithermalis DSM 15212]
MNASDLSKIEYTIIDVFDKRYIWLPEIMIFFKANSLVEEILDQYNKKDKKEIINCFKGEKKKTVEKILRKFLTFEKETKKYRYIMGNTRLEQDMSINSIELNPTYSCNLRCKYCFAGDRVHFKKGYMTIDTAKQAIDFLFKEGIDKDTLYIAFIGGEPLINMPMIEFALKYSTEKAKKYNKQINYATTVNGTLLTREIMDLFDRYQVQAMISMDSPEPVVQNFLRPTAGEKGSYDLIKENGWISMLGSKGKSAVRSTITPYNLNLFDIAKTYYEAGFKHVHVEEVTTEDEKFVLTHKHIEYLKGEYNRIAQYLLEEVLKGKDIDSKPLFSRMYEIHNRKPRYNFCGAFNNSIGISPEGKFYPCDWMMDEQYNIGSLDSGLDKEKYRRLREQIPIPAKCRTCWARNLCGMGCRAKHKTAYAQGHEIDCDLELHKYKLQLYLYSEIAEKNPEFLKRYEKKIKLGEGENAS